MPTNLRISAHSRRRRTAGFSLIEVLLAIGVFAIGMIAVASIFPVAILLQKETLKQVETTHFTRNAKALVIARGFEAPDADWNPIATSAVVSPMPAAAMDDWSLSDRSYNALADTNNRTAFWVPLCFDNDPNPGSEAWQVYIFVVRGSPGKIYDSTSTTPLSATSGYNTQDPDNVPAVLKGNMDLSDPSLQLNQFETDYASSLKIGDQIVASDGAVYSIQDIVMDPAPSSTGLITIQGAVTGNPTDFWYAAPAAPGDPSTFVALIPLIDEIDGEIIRTP